MIDRELLKGARASLKKEAFSPLTPEAQAAAAQGGAPPMDPAMMAAGGAPPMDPAMMGMPPMDPAMMGMPPMDPAMMGMPPMDPAMAAGGAPPMDPAMMGMPPIDPAMLAGAVPPAEGESEDIVKVSMDDLKALVEEVVGTAKDGKPARKATNAEIMDKLTNIEATLASLTGAPPVEETGMMPPEAEATAATMPPPAPEDISAMLQSTGMPVQASAQKNTLANLVGSLKEKQR